MDMCFWMAGIWPRGSNGSDINALCRSHDGSVVATADDQGYVKLFRFPCFDIDCGLKEYLGHSSHVTNLRFVSSDTHLISTGGNDKTVFQWKMSGPAGKALTSLIQSSREDSSGRRSSVIAELPTKKYGNTLSIFQERRLLTEDQINALTVILNDTTKEKIQTILSLKGNEDLESVANQLVSLLQNVIKEPKINTEAKVSSPQLNTPMEQTSTPQINGPSLVSKWLNRIGFPQYAPRFEQQELELDGLQALTNEMLRNELGVELLGHRTKILSNIQNGEHLK